MASEEDENKPISAIIAAKQAKAAVSDSDDDLPIARFARKREREENSRRASLETKGKLAGISGAPPGALAAYGAGFEFYECASKGRMIQAFLRRWWYGYEWPVMSQIVAPPGFESLDGFPGIFVSTRVMLDSCFYRLKRV
jgi:hypothetical protein